MAIIAIDGRKYFDYGIGRYIQELTSSLYELQSPHDFLLYVSPLDASRISLPPRWNKVESQHKKYSVGEIISFGFNAKKDGVAVFHSPHYTLPWGIGGRSIVTIHDIIHLRFPQFYSLAQRAYSHAMIHHCLRQARFIITDSEFTKQDILKTFRVEEDKLRVIHLGVSSRYRPMEDPALLNDFRKRFQIEFRFILYVGNVKPHKGLATLFEAMQKLPDSVKLGLVMVGGTFDSNSNLGKQVQTGGLAGRVKQLGHIDDDDLVLAYNAAEALVMPSLYEGFGLPAVEAMACGTPVVVSDRGSLPEIVGDAAVIFEAGNSDQLADGLVRVSSDAGLRKQLIQKGKAQAKKFTWRETATKTHSLYEQVLDLQ